MNKCSLLLLSAMLCFYISHGQISKFGNVNNADLGAKADVKFPDADAVVLYREVNTHLGSVVQVHERIKIFNEEGYDHATIRIPYPNVKKLKGITYNLVDGQIVETKLDRDLVFTDEEIKGVKIKKFTFPNVSNGSIIEYSYESDKGTAANIDLQHDIPIRKEKVTVTNRTDVGVEILQNPRAFLKLTRVKEGKTTTFIANDVAALEEETFVYDMDIYRSYLRMNFTSFGETIVLNSWDKLAGKIVGFDYFGQGVKPKRFYDDEVEAAIGGEIDKLKQTKIIYNFVKDRVKWNEDYGYIPDQSIRETFKDEEGGLPEINILLVSMLRSVGVQANPVLVSTKRNGMPLTASASSFNAVLVSVTIGENHYILDAALDNSTFDFIDTRFLNWQGLRIFSDNTFDWVYLTNSKLSAKNVIGKAVIGEDLSISGMVKERHSGYFDVYKKDEIKDLGESKIETIVDVDFDGLEISEVDANTGKENATDIQYDFEMENAVDDIDGKLYISPLLFLALPENPFQKESRTYSIDFEFKQKEQTMLTLELPEGYQIESLPEVAKISLPDNAGSFVYRISGAGRNIQVSSVFQINTPLLPYDKYDILKEFFLVRMAKEEEKMVLSKI